MNYIKATCRTNLDGYDCSKVELFTALPNKGDCVRVRYKGLPSTLKVVEVTHDEDVNGVPFIEVELHERYYTK